MDGSNAAVAVKTIAAAGDVGVQHCMVLYGA